MPTVPGRYAAPTPVWITVTGWAAAATRRFSRCLIVGPSKVYTAQEAQSVLDSYAARSTTKTNSRAIGLRQFAKDFLALVGATRYTVGAARRLRAAGASRQDLGFIWQHHELWQWSGWFLAKWFGVPWVLFVDAPVVWEARKWGVKRHAWGRILELAAERPQFRAADLVVCVSEPVAKEVVRLGGRAETTVVAACGVDTERFAGDLGVSDLRSSLGIGDRVVVGWLGSFRKFHGVDLLIAAFSRLSERYENVALLLVGDGAERSALESLVHQFGLDNVIFTGAVGYSEVPRFINLFDIAVVVDPGRETFHYSPLKLAEYMACGRPVVAPRVPQVEQLVGTEGCAMLTGPGDVDELSNTIGTLLEHPVKRTMMGLRARSRIEQVGTWDYQLETIMRRLSTDGDPTAGRPSGQDGTRPTRPPA